MLLAQLCQRQLLVSFFLITLEEEAKNQCAEAYGSLIILTNYFGNLVFFLFQFAS